jgi:1-deoxy-D-xylulose-5-phosphate reductoisomerase
MACVLNAANEVAVEAFLQEKIGFLNMSDLIADCLEKITFVANPTLDDYVATNKATRVLAKQLL